MGAFTYEDHGTPWGTAARDLRISLSRGVADRAYLGRASFSDSTITIQKYEPFRASMQSRFTIDGSKLHFSRIDLASEGAQSVLTGDIDMGRWPEQTYQIASKIDFPTQKNIFFHRDTFQVSGKGDFHGTFHLFKGGRELKGTFSSPLVGVNAWRFPDLRGSVLWLPDRMEVTNATSRLYGGTAQFDYRLAPLNKKGRSDRRDVGCRLHRRRSRAADGLPRNARACGSAAARPGAIISTGSSGSGPRNAARVK